jgi:hypothetical protein
MNNFRLNIIFIIRKKLNKILCYFFGHDYKNVGNLEKPFYLCFKCYKKITKDEYKSYIRKRKIKNIL